MAPIAETAAREFRPIQYLGSKWRIREEISDAVRSVATGGVVHDLFAGTGVVSANLAANFDVEASDIQEYSRVLTSALTSPAEVSWDDWFARADAQVSRWVKVFRLEGLLALESDALQASEDSTDLLGEMIESGSIVAAHELKGRNGWLFEVVDEHVVAQLPTIFRYYGGVYFGYRQALMLDALAVTARDQIDGALDTRLAALLGLASDLTSSVGGHFAQPIRTRDRNGEAKVGTLLSVASARSRSLRGRFLQQADRYRNLVPSDHRVTAHCEDFREALDRITPSSACVYADPPYTRDHYSRFYHVLETLARGDDPGLARTTAGKGSRASRGLYRVERHQSPFSIVRQAASAFDELFHRTLSKGCPLVLSYSPTAVSEKPRQRSIGLDELISIATRHASDVRVAPISGVKHARLNRRDVSVAAPEVAEVVIVATP